MNKIIAAVVIMMFLGLSGCATEEYVRSQTDPLADHVGKLETRVNALEGMCGKPASLSDSDKAMIQQAIDKAQQALDATNRLSADIKRAEEAAKNAEEAAKKAEHKSEKLFKLEQKK